MRKQYFSIAYKEDNIYIRVGQEDNRICIWILLIPNSSVDLFFLIDQRRPETINHRPDMTRDQRLSTRDHRRYDQRPKTSDQRPEIIDQRLLTIDH